MSIIDPISLTPISAEAPEVALEQIRLLVVEKRSVEEETTKKLARQQRAIEKEYQLATKRCQDDLTAQGTQIEQGHRQRLAAIEKKYLPAIEKLKAGHAIQLDRLETECRTQIDELDRARSEEQYEATMLFEANREGAKERFAQIAQKVEDDFKLAEQYQTKFEDWLRYWSASRPADIDRTEKAHHAGALEAFHDAVAKLELILLEIENQKLPRYAQTWILASAGSALTALFIYLGSLLAAPPLGPASGLVLGGGLTLLARFLGMRTVQLELQRLGSQFLRLMSEVRELRRPALEEVNAGYRRERSHFKQEQQRTATATEQMFLAKTNARKQQLEENVEAATETFRATLRHLETEYQSTLQETKDTFPKALAEAKGRAERGLIEAENAREQSLAAANQAAAQSLAEMDRRWEEGFQRFRQAVQSMAQWQRDRFPDWDSPYWQDWTPPETFPSALPFGRYHVLIPTTVSKPDQVEPVEGIRANLPALLDFPNHASLMLKVGNEGRQEADETLLNIALRLLTSLPPGQVRFTIIDPVGLGQNFSSLMQLADFEEALITNRIWTEPMYIGQRLADLTEHMETVIQKYLRNEFQTIEEYNASAGEVAEPFRFLLIANFPMNFNEEHARRLMSIVSSGARCGVHTLMSVDLRQPLPYQFELSDLEQHCLTLAWKQGRFQPQHKVFEPYPLTLESPPPAERLPPMLRLVGAAAKNAKRVRVPFEFIAPKPEDWWKGDSRHGLTVPLGRAGAVKRQALQLGEGTSQHVLVAGKTGSGKSTLLHALVTNIALTYSPDEVELYLIDFKKGVEFKIYARHELPHARVVAIESDREFGHSVMQRLDNELRVRGEKFRSLGVNDVAGFRKACPAERMPRILLVVDEFQELFVEDDKLAQDAALLLDRLVRQGRAFGIHVLLGSQTLGGAYSLARSTLGQMAVRIALQCSEADAHLILSEDNSAARLLSRPGEAIYNDANGLVEGNHPFQVVWLDDDERERYLAGVGALAAKSRFESPTPQVVFEGNAPADIGKNRLLARELEGEAWPSRKASYFVWLGDAIAIKDPTAVELTNAGGKNLIIVGQRDEPAQAMLLVGMAGLAAQLPPGDPLTQLPGTEFFVLDASPADAVYAGCFGKLADALPHSVTVASHRDVPAVLGRITAELADRRSDPDARHAPWFLVIFGLQRFRDLRKEEDDFGFSRGGGDDPPSPAKQFAEVIKEGPSLGIHVLTWCDSLNNAQRMFDRQLLREFESRVLLQMSAQDSSVLIDNAAAGKLGPHRAILAEEEQGRTEKFRPYDLPTNTWFAKVSESLRRKGRA